MPDVGKKPEQLLGRAFEELKINPGLNQSPNTHRDEVVLERDGRPPITAKIDRIKYELKGEEEKDVYYIKDITDKRRKEQSLHREQERIHSALASMGDAVITINTRGVVDYINPSAETITGWRNDEAQGHPVMQVFNVIHEHSREPIADQFAAVYLWDDGFAFPWEHSWSARAGGSWPYKHLLHPYMVPISKYWGQSW